MRFKPHKKLANALGYDLQRIRKQVVIETHLRSLLRLLEVETVLDVGANIGQYAQGLRDQIGFKGEIHSFEPIPSVYQALQINAASDPKWHVHNYALSNDDGEAEIRISNSTTFSSLHDSNERGQARFGEELAVAETVSVPKRRLDTLLPTLELDLSKQTTFLKMDTQGHDHWVFDGAERVREHFVGLQSEVSVMGIYEDVPCYLEMLETYKKAGFELTAIFPVSRYENTGHIIELDCVCARDCASE